MKCHNYQAERVELARAVSQHTFITLQTLLFCNDSLPININIEMFEAVQTYIFNSYKRKYVHKLLVNRLLKPAQEKVWLSGLTVPQRP